jgi:hypothetical protein
MPTPLWLPLCCRPCLHLQPLSRRLRKCEATLQSLTGGWAHVASTLREDFPHSAMQHSAAPDDGIAAAPNGSFSAAAPQPPAAALTAPDHQPVAAVHPSSQSVLAAHLAQPHTQQQPTSQPATAPVMQAAVMASGPSLSPALMPQKNAMGGHLPPSGAAASVPFRTGLPRPALGSASGSQVVFGQQGRASEGMSAVSNTVLAPAPGSLQSLVAPNPAAGPHGVGA